MVIAVASIFSEGTSTITDATTGTTVDEADIYGDINY